jgi:acetylornithine deacetylase
MHLTNLDRHDAAMRQLLSRCIQFESVSGNESAFTRFIAEWAKQHGLIVDLWQADERELSKYPVASAKHVPLADRPTLVIKLSGVTGGRSLIFNAHADVVAAPRPEQWKLAGPWAGVERDGKFVGRGACDVKGPLVSALWAMLILRDIPDRAGGDVMLELVPGEEDCVTLGTLTSVVRGHTADACVVLEPTESLPRCASRPGCRFEITCLGRSVHGTVKWLGADAIELARDVLLCLPLLEQRWNDRAADPLFDHYPIARPVTVDLIRGGEWQGMVADRCVIGGYLELLPRDEPSQWMDRFISEMRALLSARGQDERRIQVVFPEQYPGHRTNTDHPLCRAAEAAIEESANLLQNIASPWNGWGAFNSGCEAGLRANLLGTPTLVWGPGSLAQAHAVDEFVEFAQVRAVAAMFARFAAAWTVGFS